MGLTLAFDWKRVSGWCFIGAFVMLVWLMAPVARCSWRGYNATDIEEIRPDEPGLADHERVSRGGSFVNKITTAAKQCYRKTPLLGQEPYKTTLLLGFTGAGVLLWVVSRYLVTKRKTLGS